jgi:cold shock protein
MNTGVVVFFKECAGWGFLRRDDGAADLWFEVASLEDPEWIPAAADTVDFVEGMNSRGLCATVVRLAEDTPFLGRVKSFSDEKGYGWIVPDEDGPDVWVHRAQVKNAGAFPCLERGQRVFYSEAMMSKGICARNVHVVFDSPNSWGVAGSHSHS